MVVLSMIAIQSFKYLIWDYCLTKLFEGFEKNFRTNPNGLIKVPLKELRPGMVIDEIWIIIDSRGYKGMWKNCSIVDVIYHESGKKWNLKEVWFTWASHWSNEDNKTVYPVTAPGGTGLSSHQSVDWDINGVNELGITPEFYIHKI